jgi:hypothetical protein
MLAGDGDGVNSVLTTDRVARSQACIPVVHGRVPAFGGPFGERADTAVGADSTLGVPLEHARNFFPLRIRKVR